MMNLKSAAKANPICRFSVFGVLACLVFSLEVAADVTETVRITRLAGGPIIHQGLDASIGANIQGPSLIKVPFWVAKPLGSTICISLTTKGAIFA
jgi:hypothetical protein